MIIGIGHDIVDIARIEKDLARHQERFTERCFTEKERALATARREKGQEAATYAKRFAAKEALVKALGIGVRDGISLKDIETRNDELGKPSMTLSGKALEKLNMAMPEGYDARIHLSLSDDAGHASAFVVIEACQKPA
jgi:holo-[acyl-carrier protein] synthase